LGGRLIAGDFLRPAQPKTLFAVEVTQRWIRLGQYFFQPRDYRCRLALQNRLVHLCFEGAGVVGVWMERSKEGRGTRQVAFGLCNNRL
jgi:hypothetical protein